MTDGGTLATPIDMVTLLDGPMGTQLLARGVPTPTPLWSAWALRYRPSAVAEIHRDYVAAGAQVHTADTFRTKARNAPDDWLELALRAVRLARQAGCRTVAGSIAPLEDCYEPWNSPPDPFPEHLELAEALAGAGVDILLCETFPHVGEALAAVRAAVSTGVTTWVSFTAGHDASLLTPEEVRAGAIAAIDLGAEAVLVNCIAASATLRYVRELADLGVPFGAYANAGRPEEHMGWESRPEAPALYADHAETWVASGATLIGSCCGTGPEHIAELARRLAGRSTMDR